MDRECPDMYKSIETGVMAKLPGDTTWSDCLTSSVSGARFYVNLQQNLDVGEFIVLQFMTQKESGITPGAHFSSLAQVVRIYSEYGDHPGAIEFIVDDAVRKKILRYARPDKG